MIVVLTSRLKFLSITVVLTMVGCSVPKDLMLTTRQNTVIIKSIENPIRFNGNLKDYKATISNGTISKTEDSLLTVLVDTSYQTTITLKKGSLVKQFDFRVKKFPNPVIRLWTNGKGDINNMTVEEFKSLKSVAAGLSDFDLDCFLKLESYDVMKITGGGTQTIIKSINPVIDFRRLALIANKGDTYIFTNIRVRIEQTDRVVDGQEFTMHLK